MSTAMRRYLGVLFSAMLWAGCAAPAPTAAPSQTATATVAATAAPTLGATPAPTERRFRTTSFGVPFSVDARLMTSTWRQHLEQANWTYFGYRGTSSDEDAEGISFHALDSIAPSPACGPSDPWPTWLPWAPTGPRDQAFIDWLQREVPGPLGDRIPVTLGGLAGSQIDIGPDQLAGCEVLWITRTQSDNALLLTPVAQQRLIVLDVDGRTLVIVLATVPPSRFEALAADAAKLFATLTFEGD